MFRIRFSLLTAFVFVTVAFTVPGAVSPAHAAPGELIKIPGNTAVYFHAADGKRYVFPNEPTYFSWYQDFSQVKTVSPEELAQLRIGGNVVYRPGTRLVKSASNPRVYAVERHGTLRFVDNESVVIALYGNDWNKRVDDIPDAFWTNYYHGVILTEAKYPDGTVLKRLNDGAYFQIERGLKRRLSTPAVLQALRIREEFVISTGSTLSEYPDGADMTVSDVSFADPSQLVSQALTTGVPTFTIEGPGTQYLARGGESTLLKIRIASPRAINVTRLGFKLVATRDDRPSTKEPIEDDDLGGLIYGLGISPNLRDIRIETVTGAEPFGRKQLFNSAVSDQVQTVSFVGSVAVSPDVETVLYLRTDLQSIVPLGEGYIAMFIGADATVTDPTTGEAVAHQPVTEIAGPALTIRENILRVTAVSAGQHSVVRGASDIPITSFRVEAAPLSANRITSLTVQGYIDDESSGQYGSGSDVDAGSETRVSQAVPRIYLADSAGKRITGPLDVPYSGRVTFSNLPIILAPGDAAVFTVRGDTNKDLETELQPDLVAFDIVEAANDLVAYDDSGTRISSDSLIPNGATHSAFRIAIKKNGSAEISWDPQGGTIIAGREFVIGNLNITAKDDAFTLKALAFTQETMPSPLASARLEYKDSAGLPVSIPGTMLGNSVIFTGVSIPLQKDGGSSLVLRGVMQSRDAGAAYASVVRVRFESGGPFEMISGTNGRTISETSFGTADFTVKRNVASGADVRFSMLDVGGFSYALARYRDVGAPILAFSLRAAPEGSVRVRRLTFAVTPTDVATPGADNDALERWADINGDFIDDDGAVTLKLIPPAGGSAVVIGEDSSTRISYSIARYGGRQADSSALESRAGDYAVIDYEFSEGNELSVGAGGSQNFVLEMNLNLLNYDSDRSLTTQILGGQDLLWTDIPYGTYVTRTDSVGAPMSATITLPK